MERLDKAKLEGLDLQLEKIVTCLEEYLKRGYEGGY